MKEAVLHKSSQCIQNPWQLMYSVYINKYGLGPGIRFCGPMCFELQSSAVLVALCSSVPACWVPWWCSVPEPLIAHPSTACGLSIWLSESSDKSKSLGSLTRLPRCGRQLQHCNSVYKSNVPTGKLCQNPTALTVSNILLLFNCTDGCAELFAAYATKHWSNNWTHALSAYILWSYKPISQVVLIFSHKRGYLFFLSSE